VSQLSHAQFPLRRHPDLLVDHRRARSAAVAEPRGANVESRDRLRWPASFRNGGRNQIGTVADIKSESPAGLPRNSHFIRTLKENLLWVRTFKTIEELRAELVAFARRYNETWLVARHGYKTPARVREEQTTPRIAID